MSKLILMKGLPGCGKSTRAKEIIEKSGNTIRVNKDLLRTMLHFDNFNYKNEDLTISTAISVARCALENGRNVIIDDTNLNPKTVEKWKGFLSGYNHLIGSKHEIEIVDMTDIPVEMCVARDLNREKYVGGTVIKNMALQYGIQPVPAKGFVICDIDGTVADCDHRRHFVEKITKDWKGFFSSMGEDPLIKETAKIVINYYNKMHTIIYVSARPEEYKKQTLEWLEKNNLSFGWTLIMRGKEDKRPDVEVKQDIYDKYFKDKYPIEIVIDDRPRVIEMWRKNGLKVLDVGKGIDF